MANAAGQEISVETNQPIELYEFTVGSDTYRFTSAEGDVTFNGFTWLDRSLERSSFSKMTEAEQTEVTVKMPTTETVASNFIGIQPANRVDLVIRRVHEVMSPPTAILLFRGFVTTCAFKDEVATMSLRPFNELFSREMPRQTYQGLCNHVHYDSRCGIVESAAPNQLIATVISQTNGGEVINVPGAGAVADNKSPLQAFRGGFVRKQDFSDFRMILDQDGDDLTLLLPFRDSVLGTTVVVQRGCDRSVATCVAKYNNIANYGGHPHVPGVSPFSQGTFIEPASANEPPSIDLGKFIRQTGGF